MTQLPPSQPHLHRPLHVKRVRPKTYTVAVYLVVAFVAFEVVALISVFWLRSMIIPVNVHLPTAQTGTQPSANQPLIGPVPPMPDIPSLPSLAMTVTHPTLLSVPSATDPMQQVINLNQEALAFLNEHALESALDTLLKAEDIDPPFPDTLKNLADTYNLMNDLPRSKIFWQRIVDIGPAVGTIYGIAKDHVVLMDTQNASPLNDASPLPRKIYIEYVEKTPVETLNGQAQFHLRATLGRKDSIIPDFDQKRLQPYVIFYQQMPDGSLVPDLAQRKGSFDDTFLFWGTKTAEAFGVDYLMPIPGALGADNNPVGKYYGFIIGIYYNKVLQDSRSEPSDLVNRIPLPNEIE